MFSALIMCQLLGLFSLLVCFSLNSSFFPLLIVLYCKFQLDFYCGRSHIPYLGDKLENSFIAEKVERSRCGHRSLIITLTWANWAERSFLIPLNFVLTHSVNQEDDFKFIQLGFLLFAKPPIYSLDWRFSNSPTNHKIEFCISSSNNESSEITRLFWW